RKQIVAAEKARSKADGKLGRAEQSMSDAKAEQGEARAILAEPSGATVMGIVTGASSTAGEFRQNNPDGKILSLWGGDPITEKVTVRGNGDVLVGTVTNPPYPNGSKSLYIANDGGDAKNSFRLDGAGDYLYIVAASVSGAAAGSGIIFRTATAGAGESDRMTIWPDGHVTILGNLNVGGTLSKGAGSFKIDHPVDPANKYLSHSFVESPDMMNIYNGVVVLDAKGEAWVMLPEWFEPLNSDFRYQLTCIGGFAPVFIAEEIAKNRFKIAGGREGLKVSWQVTGIRQDAYANSHRIPVEEEKPVAERGHYLHPELYGQTQSKDAGPAVVRAREARGQETVLHAAPSPAGGTL
ncbi:MAG: hypothetical protein LAO07_04985, partial [Acidobacteriia bacterium]|nr:hypothetical protein [Terriglobia bacterium]